MCVSVHTCMPGHVCVWWITAFVCQYTSNISESKDVDDFPYLGSLHPSKADTGAQIHHRISSASGVMPDSKEEFVWTVTSRWRTACLQSGCSSHSSAKGTNLDLPISYRRHIDDLESNSSDGILPPGNQACEMEEGAGAHYENLIWKGFLQRSITCFIFIITIRVACRVPKEIWIFSAMYKSAHSHHDFKNCKFHSCMSSITCSKLWQHQIWPNSSDFEAIGRFNSLLFNHLQYPMLTSFTLHAKLYFQTCPKFSIERCPLASKGCRIWFHFNRLCCMKQSGGLRSCLYCVRVSFPLSLLSPLWFLVGLGFV